MPSILKRLRKPDAYIFPEAAQLEVGEETPPQDRPPSPEGEEQDETEQDLELEEEPRTPEDFAQIQARAILNDAKKQAAEYRRQEREKCEAELEGLRAAAREEGYSQGYADGMAAAGQEARKQLDQLAQEQCKGVELFLEQAARLRDQILDESREELKDLALTIAEKVIRVSLRGSSDILRRMVESATDKKKRCEWAHIYIADCDVRGKANTVPELTAALSRIADRVRVIPMDDDESGTCIVELPNEIIDVSVSTQLGNIREILSNAPLDE